MKQNTTTGMLLISALLLGAFIWFVERDSESSQQQELRARTLFNVYPDSIDLIQLERGGVQIECTKASGEWRLSRPDAPVNTAVVEQMIAGMTAVERGEFISADTMAERGLTPDDYGFDNPRARITFKNNRGTTTWLIGRDAPLGNMLYVMNAAGKDIIAAPQTLLNLVPKDPAWIRDHTLFNSQAGSVRGIDLRRAGGFVQLRQSEGGKWLMQQPHAGRADRLAVNALIEQALSAQIGDFVADERTDLTIYGLEEAVLELTLFSESGETQTLHIGKPVPDRPAARYAKWVDDFCIFTVPSEWAAGFEMSSNNLRNRQLVDGSLRQISSLIITSGEEHTELVQTNGQWQVMRPARWDAEPESVEALLTALDESVIEEFIDNPTAQQTAQMENTSWAISFSMDGQTNILHLSEPLADGRLMVQRNNEPSFGIIGSEPFSTSFRNALFYRDRTVLQINPPEIKALTLTAAENTFRVEKVDGQYLAADRTHKANAEALFKLTEALTGLRTKQYIAFNPDSLAAYGLETPLARLSITLNNTNTLGRVLLFGNTVGDGRYAMLQGQPVVFILPESSASALTKELTQPFEKQTEETSQP